MIASPLEQEYVDRVAAAEPDRIELIYRPDLMPPTRYLGDHNGPADWPGFETRREEWRSLLARAEVLWDFATHENIGPLELSPNLRWVQGTSAGMGQYVKQLGLQSSDVIVTTASGVHGEALAEFVFAALLYHSKLFGQLQAWQREHQWVRNCGFELRGKTIAVIGPGRIGREIAKVAHAFGMTVWGMASNNDPERAAELGLDRIFARPELPELLAGADAVVLSMPHTPESEGMIGAAEFALMKRGVVFVNIARGLIVDEDAMIEAIRAGQIGLAALDVFRTEPLPTDSPLWDLPNVIVSPHSASTAPSENSRITDLFIANLHAFLDGRYDAMSPVLDKQRLY
jgi:phosphoglycerate dehydrogenase-like enzyme